MAPLALSERIALTMNIENIKELASLMKDLGLSALEVSEEGKTIKLERRIEAQKYEAQPSGTESKAKSENVPRNENCVTSPMVGVFYAAPSPDSKPYVTVGSEVKKGDVLCIVEAMKLMNEILSERDGVIAEVCVENGQLVEFGQTLFVMR